MGIALEFASEGFDFRGIALVRRRGADALRYVEGTTGGTPDELITPDTRFQLASVSKQCAAAAILLLADRGELRLDDRLNGILPGGPSAWDGITIHQLLCHRSGPVHWHQLEDLDLTSSAVSADELLARFRAAPLLSTPGSTYSYSSPGYVLLAHVVEAVAATPYAAFLDREVFGPVGMSSTFAGNAQGSGFAAPLHDGERVDSFELDVIGMGAGDVWSTADDQATWNATLRHGGLLSEASSLAMCSVQSRMPDRIDGLDIDGYGYGLVLAHVQGRPIVFHAGDNAGFQSLSAWLPDDDAQAVLLTNDDTTDMMQNGLRLLGELLGS